MVALQRGVGQYTMPLSVQLGVMGFPHGATFRRLSSSSWNKLNIGTPPRCQLCLFCDNICIRLAKRIKNSSPHPLSRVFTERQPDPSGIRQLRSKQTIVPVAGSTSRLKNSVTKYAVCCLCISSLLFSSFFPILIFTGSWFVNK